MVKESKIKELIYDKVANLLDKELIKYGFKYLKSKRHFSRQEKEFIQIINLYSPYSPLQYNEDTEQLFLLFNISSEIEIPNYEKWYLEKLGERSHFSFRTEVLTSQIELSLFDDFEKDNFYTPTTSQEFKRSVTLSLMNGRNQNIEIIPIIELLNIRIPKIIANLSEKSSILRLFESREYPFQNTFLLFYGGFFDLSKEEIEKTYQYYLNEINNKLKISETESNGLIENLDNFIKSVQKVAQITYSNPYKRSIKLLNTQNDNFNFSLNTGFNEILRLDISQFDVKNCNINSNGDILIFADNQKIIKLNSRGELVFEAEIETKKGFDKVFWGVPTGVLNETDEFYVNNYIVTSNNKLIELALPIEKNKKNKLQSPHIGDLTYWQKEDKYLLLYEYSFLTYNKGGQLEKTLKIEERYGNRIIIDKEWIVLQKNDTAIIIIDFEGKILGTYEYGNANNHYEFSSFYEYLICFSYATKSQFYNLTNGKKATLWAHPTFIKGYKEKMYDDINHNFGMNIAKFSPDDKYIVGGADHGKYVAWTLPKLDRIELIPQLEMIKQLEPHIRTPLFNTKSESIVTKAELMVLDNQTFLKNRGNDISKIIFFEKGDIFITELGYGKFVLSWDRNFNNLTYKKNEGKLDFHSNKYLTQKTKAELVIYEPT